MKTVLVLSLLIVGASASIGAEDVTETLINPYYYCVGRSTGNQPDRFRNPDAAIERAFLDCRTEELAIRAYAQLGHIPPAQIDNIIVIQRSRLKKALGDQLRAHAPRGRN